MLIKFTKTIEIPDIYQPYPAINKIPEWYKKTNSYVNNNKFVDEDLTAPHTIKKCIPVFDAMTHGYIIPTYVDIQVSTKDDQPFFVWPSQNPISFHPISQAPNYPGANTQSIPKWNNPWSISTPKGYSILILAPMHHSNDYFEIMPGIVDTDSYSSPINFPFMLKDRYFNGIIPAGTPMAQIVMIKRESWKMGFGDKKDLRKQYKDQVALRSLLFNSYKKLFWKRKEFR